MWDYLGPRVNQERCIPSLSSANTSHTTQYQVGFGGDTLAKGLIFGYMEITPLETTGLQVDFGVSQTDYIIPTDIA